MSDYNYKNKIEQATEIYEDYLNQLSKIHADFLKGLAEIRKKDDLKKLEELKK